MLTPLWMTKRLGRDERGFTLIETLVAMVTGIIVTGALFAILEVSLHQSARVVDVVQATQLGRTTMNKMVEKLHSACIAPGYTPIREGSSSTELKFVSATSNKPVIPNASESATEGAYLHEIVYNGVKGTLTDTAWPSAGTSPEFTFPKTPGTSKVARIGEDITQSEGAKKEAIPMFEYFAYATQAEGTSEAPFGTISTTPVSAAELTKTQSEETASVLIRFRAASADNNPALNRRIDLQNQVTLAFNAPNSEATISAGPCE